MSKKMTNEIVGRLIEQYKLECKPCNRGDGSWWEVFSMNSRPQHHRGPSLFKAVQSAIEALDKTV